MRLNPLLPSVFFFLLATSLSAQVNLGFTFGYESVNRTYVEFPRYGADHTLGDLTEFGCGLQADQRLNDRWGIRVGWMYARKGYVQHFHWTYPVAGNSRKPVRAEMRLHYLDLPLTVYRMLSEKQRYSLAVSAGFIPSFSLSSNEVSEMGDGSIKPTDYVNPAPSFFLVAARLGLINNLQLTERFLVSVEPYIAYRYGLIQEDDILKAGLVKGGLVSVLVKI